MFRTLFSIVALFSALYAWESDYSKAVEMSREDQKPLLLFFTGSDWSGLAMKMKNEMLDSPSFQEQALSQFHCLEIDFPHHKPLSEAVQLQNESLKKRFGVEELPLLLLLDSTEREIVRVGYLPESGAQLAEELTQIVSQDRELCTGLKNLPQNEGKLRQLFALAEVLTRGEAQETILDAGVAIASPFFQLEKYRRLVEEGKAVGSLRQELLKSDDYQIHFSVAMIDFQERASTLSDPREVIKPLEAYLTQFSDRDEQNVWRIEMMIAQFYLDADEWKTALKHAETAYEAAPKAMRGEIEHSLLYIRDQIR